VLVCLRPLPLRDSLPIFLYVRAIELFLSYFNLVARIRGVERLPLGARPGWILAFRIVSSTLFQSRCRDSIC